MMTRSRFLAGLLLALMVAVPTARAQQTDPASELKSPDRNVRRRAVQQLGESGRPEAAVALAAAIADPENDVQLDAIAAELSIFLAEKVSARRRVGLVIEMRNKIAAEPIFDAGPFVLGPKPVPIEVLTALRKATHDETPRVALEALFAFGSLAFEPGGGVRRELLSASEQELGALASGGDPNVRLAALRVVGRVYARRPLDDDTHQIVGDAIITALNDREAEIRRAAMEALGAMRYERSIQALTDLFRFYGRGELAEASLDALARIAHPTSTALLGAQLGASSPALRAIAFEGIARSGDRTKARDIQAVLNGERNDTAVLAGEFALAMLGNGPIDPIIEALTRTKSHDQAFAYLVELAPGRTRLFTRATQDPDEHLRADVADVLGLSSDPAAVAILEPMLRDRDTQTVRATERGIARIRAASR
jgi:HEAT repeat protein